MKRAVKHKFLCSCCGAPHNRASYRYCHDCHAAYMRGWRKTHPLNEEGRRRDISRSKAGIAKRRGHLAPQPCQVCDSRESEMHHPDYELPHVVVWLCRPDHLAWHSHWRNVARETFLLWLNGNRTQRALAAKRGQREGEAA